MGRKYTPEQKIVNLRVKGEITRIEADRRIKKLAQEEEAQKEAQKEAQAKTNRGFFRKILDFLTP